MKIKAQKNYPKNETKPDLQSALNPINSAYKY